ncbi:MAG: tRNA uridine-5-carboxymethylaminomethyl(34) synthesis GTPase MnmE [Actinomycetota bacterium]|nr:tRNA uridine-5-carboxymethylaminomethyl(34) synthesis GTPase MnmE [Actinomycetota bacterium]
MSGTETIAAISTPIGPGGIGIIRLSGPAALPIVAGLTSVGPNDVNTRPSHTTSLTKIIDPATGVLVDEALVTIMKAPNSYTREDVIEINCHSGMPTLRAVLNLVLAGGARLAEPGEFTKRAFLSGRIDLTQAQAVISLIEAQSDAAARAAASQAEGHVSARINAYRQELIGLAAELEAAIDFSDEEIGPVDAGRLRRQIEAVGEGIEELLKRVEQGRIIDNGLTAVIVGRPNVGKSSLLNALAMEDKAIVSPQPGTTRDVVESRVMLGDVPVQIKDTAGWRVPGDDIETQGIIKTQAALAAADLVILVLDGSESLKAEDLELIGVFKKNTVVVAAINKSDLPQRLNADDLPIAVKDGLIVRLSARTGDGLDSLSAGVAGMIGRLKSAEGNEAIMAGAQQEQDLIRAKASLSGALAASAGSYGEEIVSVFVKEAIVHLGRFCGHDVGEEVLSEIFSRFCIGK